MVQQLEAVGFTPRQELPAEADEQVAGEDAEGASHHGHVSETDFTGRQRIGALRQPEQLLANGQAIDGGAERHLAVVAHPLDR